MREIERHGDFFVLDITVQPINKYNEQVLPATEHLECARRVKVDYFVIPANYHKPLVGVLIARKSKKGYPLPTGKKAKIDQEMILAAKDKGIFMYYFFADGWNLKDGMVRGHTWLQGAWRIKCFPMPNIVYNRIVYRSCESQKSVKKIVMEIQDCSEIYLFNTRFLEKWEVYQALKDHQLAHTLPVTQLFTKKNLDEFTSSFDEIFIKPRDGSLGKGIIKVICLPNGRFCYAPVSKNRTEWKKAKSINDLYQGILHLSGREAHKMILQQGLPLARFQKRIFDIRTLIQKDGSGIWTYVGGGVRIAGPDRFVTHIPNGGKHGRLGEIIPAVFGNTVQVADVEAQIQAVVRWVPQTLENNTKLNLAVLSLDLGIDPSGKVWIIEVNSKPAAFDEDQVRKKHLAILNDYFRYVYSEHNMKREG